MGEYSGPTGLESVAGTTLPEPQFPEALRALERAIALAEDRGVDFEPAIDVCLATRDAWLSSHGDTLFFGRISNEASLRFATALRQAEKLVHDASERSADCEMKDRLGRYAANIRNRAKLFEILRTEGPVAVREQLLELCPEIK